MPSSLIIVALAAAWLVVLVPMVARKRQAVAQTTDAAMAARVVRSGSGVDEGGQEVVMSEPAEQLADPEPGEPEEFEDEPARAYEPETERRYRPGRGGFDPEAAEIAARAKYAFRQRVVLMLIVLAVITAVAAGFVASMLWWLHGLTDLAFVGYLAYLRRQVRIEDEIRQRRLARMNSTRSRRPLPRREVVADEYDEYHDDEYEVAEEPRRELVGIERRPSPASRLRGRAVVVDLEDEDPAFHELDDPGQLPFRRAVGE
ncbi:gephyrin-like molybdotransferase receptor GlpR [Amycolatopsis sp.]|uniref:divisome protein SepX/GlpR n=1 Tax=Amycolatopsis sp. TaxID=37632 RepID=UPI002B99015D|nr:gephyrin-like molybdotransferase receptor GlpR [Amycolatopsis sp.]HVV13820.1 gephyrin-like molybdotransferase receptor GlpR [Amycolatopsis sp.]